jgi:hypothetical protein
VLCSNKDFSSALPGQYLGLANSSCNGKETNHFVAVELDTMQNEQFEDIDDNHIGVDINSLSSAASATLTRSYYTSDGALRTMSLVSGQPIQVWWVDYDSKQTKLTGVSFANHGIVCRIFSGDWRSCQQALHPGLEPQAQRRTCST